jgi:chemotaxis protein MotB
MFARTPALNEEEERKDIFAPVADLMVGVVFVFIVLMIALVLNLQKEDTVPKSEYEKLRTEYERLRAENDRLTTFARFVRESNALQIMSQLAIADQTRNQLLEELKKRLDSAKIEVKVDPRVGTLRLPSSKLFEIGEADPTQKGADTIKQLGAVLSEVLPCYSLDDKTNRPACRPGIDLSRLSAVYVEGHTDVTPFSGLRGRFRDNWDLSAGRAIEAYKLMTGQFEPLKDLKNKDGDALLGVSGYADTRPVIRDAPDRRLLDIADQDRRIEVRVIMTTNEQLVNTVLNELNSRLRDIDDLIAR